MKWLADLPSTNARIVVSLLLIVATAVRFLVWGPSSAEWTSWLVFLGTLAGIDTAYFIGKRVTYRPGPPESPDIEDAKAGAEIRAATPVATPKIADPVRALTLVRDSERGED
jgi:hypothetical protein